MRHILQVNINLVAFPVNEINYVYCMKPQVMKCKLSDLEILLRRRVKGGKFLYKLHHYIYIFFFFTLKLGVMKKVSFRKKYIDTVPQFHRKYIHGLKQTSLSLMKEK